MIRPIAPQPLLPLQQSALYHAALTRIGAQACLYPVCGRQILVVQRSCQGLGRVALVSRPVVADPRGLIAARRALGAQVLIVNAETPADADCLYRAGFLRLSPPRAIAALSLAGHADDWLARMDGKWRNRLRHGQRHGLAITHGPMPPDPRHWLFYKDAGQQAARGYRNLPPALVAAMAQDPGALHLFTARHAGRSIAAMLFARHGDTASYLMGWSGAAGRTGSAHNLILWRAMGDLAGFGVAWIDLGLGDARTTPGLARFKLGSGAAWRPLGGTWAQAGLMAPLHGMLRRCRAIPPLHATGARGPVAPR